MTTTTDPPSIDHRHDCRDPGAVSQPYVGHHGDLLRRCASCGRLAVLERAEPEEAPRPAPVPRGRYALTCARCGVVLRFHRPGPRLPVCDGCRTT